MMTILIDMKGIVGLEAYVKLGQNGIVFPLIKLVGEAGQRRRSYETSVEAAVFVGHDLRVVPS